MKKALKAIVGITMAATMAVSAFPMTTSAMWFYKKTVSDNIDGVIDYRVKNDVFYVDSAPNNEITPEQLKGLDLKRREVRAHYFVFDKNLTLLNEERPFFLQNTIFNLTISVGYDDLYGIYVYEGSPIQGLYEEMLEFLTVDDIRSEEWLRKRLPINLIPDGEELPKKLCDDPQMPKNSYTTQKGIFTELSNNDIVYEQLSLLNETTDVNCFYFSEDADVYGATDEDKVAELSLILQWGTLGDQRSKFKTNLVYFRTLKGSNIDRIYNKIPAGSRAMFGKYKAGEMSGTMSNGLTWKYEYTDTEPADCTLYIDGSGTIDRNEYSTCCCLPYTKIVIRENVVLPEGVDNSDLIEYDEEADKFLPELEYSVAKWLKNKDVSIKYGSQAHAQATKAIENRSDFTYKITYYGIEPSTINAEGPFGLYGDADGNGSVDINDVIKLMCYAANPGVSPLTETEKVRCDVYSTGDGINVSDANRIQMYLANMIEG